ncbi:C-type lectin domain family 4 member E isoform X2 [Myripristis murdjan]|uniref:C-type lectin domain family 4 member E isoform X2 n=1 Tax=Myripristis murdjan TaxID=586833 RepID=UPI0011760D5D|nr:C-type lectin domain family 4 member E-like isoform X2 [Myripristis murdjan]
MYIKFCRNYGLETKPPDEANAKLSPESKLSVELEGEKGKETQTQGNVRVYRALCVLLSIICLVLLLVIIILGMKFQAGSKACPEGEAITEADVRSVGRSLPPQTCSFEKCQALFPQSQSHSDRSRQPRLGCQQCADGWLPFDSECYYLSRHRLNWEESQRNCTARGGHLAIITNQRLQSFLSTEGSVRYWIGLRHSGTKWAWANNTVLGVSYWAEDGSKGDCGVLSGGDPPEKSWIKAPCFAHTYYICQLQM